MSFFCPHCNMANGATHEWEGMKVQCPACLRDMTLAYRQGQVIPPTGYQITFRDFCRLIDETINSRVTHPKIASLLNCTIVQMNGHFVLRQQDGALILREAAHCLIQSDPVKQQSLYNTAMDVWR